MIEAAAPAGGPPQATLEALGRLARRLGAEMDPGSVPMPASRSDFSLG